MDYNELSDEAKDVLMSMVEFCIKHGYCMGMDTGINEDGNKEQFRQELESFVKQSQD